MMKGKNINSEQIFVITLVCPDYFLNEREEENIFVFFLYERIIDVCIKSNRISKNITDHAKTKLYNISKRS
jgi:hypothetical protein